MRRVGRFAGRSVLACVLLGSLTTSAIAQPQAAKTSSNGTEAKAAATSSGPSTEKDSKPDDARKSTKKLSREERKEAAVAEARAALKEMIRKLSKGEYHEFLHQHIPIEEYVSLIRNDQPLEIPLKAIPQLIQMSMTLQKLQDGDATIDPAGRVVTFTAKEDFKVAKVIQSPYSKKADDVPAYDGELPEVIAAALKDLQANAYEDCLSRLIPPTTIHMMKVDGRWDGMIESLTPDSPMITALVTDLTALSKLDASIDGNTAEYRLPNVIHVVLRRDVVDKREAGDRVVRFSKIHGAWRFYDSQSRTNEEMEAALSRDVKGEISDDQLVIEKIGSDWRLLHVPGMPRGRRLN